MSKNNRIAIVKYSPNGKTYPAACNMKGINVGDRVCIRTPENVHHEVEVVGIQWENWTCKNEVVGHTDEDRFSFALPSIERLNGQPEQDAGLRLVN